MKEDRELNGLIRKVKENRIELEERTIRKAAAYLEGVLEKSSSEKKSLLHNIGTAKILTEMHASPEVITAGLLHNAVRFGADEQSLEKEFGEEVAGLVVSAGNAERILVPKDQARIEKIDAAKKIFYATAKDPKLILIVIAERIDDLKGMGDDPAEVQELRVIEAEQIISPFTEKVGLYPLKSSIDNLVLKYRKPEIFREISSKIEKKERERKTEIEKMRKILEKELQKTKSLIEVIGRAKPISSIYRKMISRNKSFEEIYDIVALRVITETIKDCYEVLSIVQSLWKPIPGEFDDYIVKPKPNGYQSLHTTVIGPGGMPLEIQIRTNKMNDAAEIGVAGHWLYKGIEKEEKFDKKLAWLKQLIDWQRQTPGAGSELKNLELFENTIYALTPKGDVIELPEKATVLDFAFAVHTELGFKCIRAVVNGKPVPLNFELKNGDTVQIFTSQQQKPRTQWLGFVKTSKAKAKIKQRLNIKQAKKTAAKPLRKQVVKTSDKRIRIANCCNPLLGEEIVGFKTTKRKISVHRKSCLQLNSIPAEKLINVEWEHKQGTDYIVELKVTGKDRVGLLKDILNIISSQKANIVSANVKTTQTNMFNCVFEIKLRNLSELDKIIEGISKMEEVKSVERS